MRGENTDLPSVGYTLEKFDENRKRTVSWRLIKTFSDCDCVHSFIKYPSKAYFFLPSSVLGRCLHHDAKEDIKEYNKYIIGAGMLGVRNQINYDIV